MMWDLKHSAVISILVFFTASSANAQSDPCAPRHPGISSQSSALTISLYFAQDSTRPASNFTVNQAKDAWNNTCQGHGAPTFLFNQGGGLVFRIHFLSGTDADNGLQEEARGECGFTDINPTPEGAVGSGDIYLFSREGKTGKTCDDTKNLMHELGHTFGVDDSNCTNRIMGNRDRPIQSADCQAAAQNFESPESPEPPQGCFRTPPPTTTSILTIGGPPPRKLVNKLGRAHLTRIETIDNISYLMEEWSILAVDDAEERFVFVDGSSPQRKLYVPNVSVDYSKVVLIVDAPVHAENARHIPLPMVKFPVAAIPYLGQPIEAAVRIDYGEDRQVRSKELLYSTGLLPFGTRVIDRITENMELRFASEKRHRVIVYAILEIAPGRIELRNSLVVRPLCCCNPVCA